jgi:hypothetical protein
MYESSYGICGTTRFYGVSLMRSAEKQWFCDAFGRGEGANLSVEHGSEFDGAIDR